MWALVTWTASSFRHLWITKTFMLILIWTHMVWEILLPLAENETVFSPPLEMWVILLSSWPEVTWRKIVPCLLELRDYSCGFAHRGKRGRFSLCDWINPIRLIVFAPFGNACQTLNKLCHLCFLSLMICLLKCLTNFVFFSSINLKISRQLKKTT